MAAIASSLGGTSQHDSEQRRGQVGGWVLMANQRLLMRALSELVGTLARGRAVSDVLHDLAEQVTAVLAIDGAGVSVQDGGGLRLVTTLGKGCAAPEAVQQAAQAGPGVRAWRSGQAVIITDLRREPHGWDDYERAALQAGIVAVAGIPMWCDGQGVGALSLYSTAARQWSTDDLETAQVLADLAASFLTYTTELDHQRRLVGQLREALDSRIVIEQAKGILAAEHHVTVDAAFEILRRHARSHSVSLHAVADAVVNRGLRP